MKRFCFVILFVSTSCLAALGTDFLPVQPLREIAVTPEERFQEFGFSSTWTLEDFESGAVAEAGLVVESSDRWSIQPGFSVPADGKTPEAGYALEAFPSVCAASFPPICPATVTFSFDPLVLQTLPTYVGFIWTDAESTPGSDSLFPFARVEVTDGLGNETVQVIGSIPATAIASDDDTFVGFADDDGVRSVRVTVVTDGTNLGGHFALDDLHYGLSALAGDTDIDGDIDFTDFVSFSRGFGDTHANWRAGDFDFNGHTEFRDFLRLSHNFGVSAAAPTSLVPESNAGVLFLVAWMTSFVYRPRRR